MLIPVLCTHVQGVALAVQAAQVARVEMSGGGPLDPSIRDLAARMDLDALPSSTPRCLIYLGAGAAPIALGASAVLRRFEHTRFQPLPGVLAALRRRLGARALLADEGTIWLTLDPLLLP